jgi:Malate:quinone oxidoreductase (Mqo)
MRRRPLHRKKGKLENAMTTPIQSTNRPDAVLVGAGIMGATLAVILRELDPV